MTKGISRNRGAFDASLGRGIRAGLVLSLAFGLTACVDGGEFPLFQKTKPAEGAEEVSTRRATRLIERDIEAPDVFQVTEAGLWDGRPSLGGVWVAHPDVKEPERVLIRNTSNDKFVIGALFRRELENPGPRLQVSSDAAAALGLLAGGPSNLNVTALRREEVPEAPATDTIAADLPPAATVEATPLDPIASAAAAIDKADGKPAQDIKPAAAPQPAATATLADASVGAPLSAIDDAAMETAPKKNFFQRIFKKKQPAAEIPESTDTLAGSVITNGEFTSASAPLPQTAATPVATSAAAPVVQPVSAAVTKPRLPRSDLAKPYLQIGIFSVEQNAQNTATAMRQAGMIPTVRKQNSKGKDFWRVVIGPANTSSEQAALLKKVKSTGFTDAYAVTN